MQATLTRRETPARLCDSVADLVLVVVASWLA